MATPKKPKDIRKVKYTAVQLGEILAELNAYIDQYDFPMLAEFIANRAMQHKYKITHQYIYDHPEIFEHPLSVMQAKCESFLVRQGLAGRSMPMTIFMLKQIKYGGYSDSQQIDLTSKSQPIKFVNNVPRPKKTLKG
jgi:thioredoxin-related protein